MDGTDRVSVYPTTILEDGKTGYGVVANETNVLNNLTAKVEFVLAAGTRVTFDGQQYASGNVGIKALDAQGNVMIGYIPTSALASFGLKAKVKSSDGLNVRVNPDAAADVITVLPYETEITVVGDAGTFWQLADGYVMKDYVTILP